jgi:hypothetical protein
MKPEIVLAHEFVEYIPEEVREGTLYISMEYGTAVHKCCCGCGREVVTPLSPTGWQLTFDGKSVSLYPSIGSWSLPCQSHYFITKNKVVWAPKWAKQQIARGRAAEARAKEEYYAATPAPATEKVTPSAAASAMRKPRESLWTKIKRWFS